MFSFTSAHTDPLDDTTPLPELSFDDFLEPPTSSQHEQLDSDEDDDDDDEEEYYGAASPANSSLNTPRTKKPSNVQILESRRLTPGVLKTNVLASLTSSGAVKVVSVPRTSTTISPKGGATITDVKVLNKLQPRSVTLGNATLKIGGTTISSTSGAAAAVAAAASTSTTIITPKTLSGVTMSQIKTQIKTADGRVIYLQKALPAAAATTPKLATSTTPAITTPKVAVSTILPRRLPPTKPIVLPSGIQKAVLSKGVTIAATGLVKAAVPGAAKTGAITIKGLTPMATAKAPSTAAAMSSPTTTLGKMPIQMVRTSDGKLIKLNSSTAMMLSNARSAAATTTTASTTATTAARTANSPAVTTTTSIKLSPNNVMLTKKVLGQGQALARTSTATATPIATTSGSSPTTLPAGKMLVQSSGGKQIVVSSKNIIKLSPKPGANSSASTSGASPSTSSAGAMRAIQLQGKSGVQYVRVVANNKPAASTSSSTSVSTPTATTSTAKSSAAATPTSGTKLLNSVAQKVTLMRPGAAGGAAKFVMKQAGGSIVPLAAVKTLVPKTSLGWAQTTTTASGAPPKPVAKSLGSSNQELTRKHKLTDLNTQLKQLATGSAGDDLSDSSDAAPEAKKPRYVLMMQKGKQPPQKVLAARPGVQRITVQGTASAVAAAAASAAASANANASSSNSTSSNSASSSSAATTVVGKKVYNLVKAGGVKYMICNNDPEGVPRVPVSGALRRPYSAAEAKQRRPLPLSAQQLRFKQLKASQLKQLQAQAQQKFQKPTQQPPQKPTQPQQKPSQASGGPAKPSKTPLFDILKPAVVAPPATVDPLTGLTSRRKHCNCSKSQCLKLYCDCFANGEFCQDCTCKDCFNNLEFEDERQRAIRSCLDRNPSAFKPKITARDQGDMRLHNKGCNCKRSGCLKNYCECYEAKIPCSSICKCVGCRNMEDRPDVDLDSLDALGAASGSSKTLNGLLSHDNRTNVYLTDDVVEATIMCMISRIVMHEKQSLPVEATEREVMEELGESLHQIIVFAKEKNETAQLDESKGA